MAIFTALIIGFVKALLQLCYINDGYVYSCVVAILQICLQLCFDCYSFATEMLMAVYGGIITFNTLFL